MNWFEMNEDLKGFEIMELMKGLEINEALKWFENFKISFTFAAFPDIVPLFRVYEASKTAAVQRKNGFGFFGIASRSKCSLP